MYIIFTSILRLSSLMEHGATTIYISFVAYNIPHCIAICRFAIVHKGYNARIRRFAGSPAASCVSPTSRAVCTHEFLRYHSGGSHYLSFLQRHRYRRSDIAAHYAKPCVATLWGNFNEKNMIKTKSSVNITYKYHKDFHASNLFCTIERCFAFDTVEMIANLSVYSSWIPKYPNFLTSTPKNR